LKQQNGFRTWELPCCTGRLEDRSCYFCPMMLAAQLDRQKMIDLFNSQVSGCGQRFLLRLTIGFGRDWEFHAVEVTPRTDWIFQQVGFAYTSSDYERHPRRLASPPVVPVPLDPLIAYHNWDYWLNQTIENTNSDFESHLFYYKSQYWQKLVLQEIRHLLGRSPQASKHNRTLGYGLKLLLLNYIMNHVSTVPQYVVKDLYGKLHNPTFHRRVPEGPVSPKAANRFIKTMALPTLQAFAKRTLCGLHELFREKADNAAIWDHTFAVVFLCLVVIGNTQRALHQRVEALKLNPDPATAASAPDRETASGEENEMNYELTAHIIGTFHERFSTRSTRACRFNPLSRRSQSPHSTPFVERIRLITNVYGKVTYSLSLS